MARDHADRMALQGAAATQAPSRPLNQVATAVASILAALGAASCCVIPFVLVTVGVSGAWIADLTALAPYQPYFAAVALTLLGGGFVLVYRKPPIACADGSYCARPASSRLARIGLWTASGLIAIALGFPYLAPLFIDV